MQGKTTSQKSNTSEKYFPKCCVCVVFDKSFSEVFCFSRPPYKRLNRGILDEGIHFIQVKSSKIQTIKCYILTKATLSIEMPTDI